MCWHKWDVKKITIRPTFQDHGDKRWAYFILMGVLALLVVIFIYQKDSLGFNSRTYAHQADLPAAYLMLWFACQASFVGISLLCFYVLRWLTRARDKICLKCHFTVFDATNRQDKIDAAKRVEKLERARQAEIHAEILARANKVFETRKTMRKKAQS